MKVLTILIFTWLMALPQQIFLTGFMGSGKSTHGKKLALLLQKQFVDLDKYIEEREQKSVSEIFNQSGEETFRKIETSCLTQLIEKQKNSIVALGGGTICFNNNLQLVKQNGCLIYIELPAASLFSRLEKSPTQRPLLKNYQGPELKKFIENKLSEREKFYNSAHLIISGLNLTTQQLYNSIFEFSQTNN